jgi:hypothetical protein
MDHSLGPKLSTYSIALDTEEEQQLILAIIEYDNAIQASVYDSTPSLGSMTLSYPMVDQVERQTLFAGKHSQFSDALALIIGRASKKIVYASVNLQRDTVINIDLLRQLVEQYTRSSITSG